MHEPDFYSVRPNVYNKRTFQAVHTVPVLAYPQNYVASHLRDSGYQREER